MKAGSLSQYFAGAGVKTVTATEIDPSVSRGHEFQGVDAFRVFLGAPVDKMKVPVRWVWLSDEEAPLVTSQLGTWYNSRKKQPHRSPEYRIYYPAAAEEVVYRARAGDTLFLCMEKEGGLLALLCQHSSSIEQQLLWLFGLAINGTDIQQRDLRADQGRSLDLAARYVLELINVEVKFSADQWLDQLLHNFPNGLPQTRIFSAFARTLAGEVDARVDPDAALLAWMDMEERLFLTFERHLVAERLRTGFLVNDMADVEGFVRFSLQVQNRRKSRAGYALGHHVEALLKLNNVAHKREATTEKRNGPDFLFPDEQAYHNPAFRPRDLLMLAVKTSCKDRWRQVLAEADRIEIKHLLTLEPGISSAQTDEMRKERLQLVLPRGLHNSYRPQQQRELLDVSDFLQLADRQRRIGAAPGADGLLI